MSEIDGRRVATLMPMGSGADLNALSVNLRRMYWVTAAMIAAVFVVELILAVLYVKQPEILIGIGGAVGLTIAGGIGRMSSLAREMAETTLMVLLSERLTPERLDSIVETLATARKSKSP
jgi:hypothetical protein